MVQLDGSRDRVRSGLTYQTSITEDQLETRAGSQSCGCGRGEDSVGDGRTVLKGRWEFQRYRSGIQVHVADTIEVSNYHAEAVIDPVVTISILFRGELRGTIGQMPYLLDASEGVTGYIWSVNEPAKWTRDIQENVAVRKAHISLKRPWVLNQLEGMEPDDPVAKVLRSLLTNSTEILSWQPTKRALALAEQLFQPQGASQFVDQLHSQTRALEIACEAFEALASQRAALAQSEPQSSGATEKAQYIREFIEENIAGELTLKDVSKSMGMGVNTMQRAFKSSYGLTVMDYIRERRLELAKSGLQHDGLTIAQAAHIAGYNSPANFSTAFKRSFGVSPSAMKG